MSGPASGQFPANELVTTLQRQGTVSVWFTAVTDNLEDRIETQLVLNTDVLNKYTVASVKNKSTVERSWASESDTLGFGIFL